MPAGVRAGRMLAAGDVSGDGEPAAAAASPDVGVAAVTGTAVRQGVGGSRMNDRDVSHDAHVDVVGFEIGDFHGHGGVLQECFAVQKRSVRLGAEKVVGQNFLETRYVGGLYGTNVIAVEVQKTVEIGLQSRRGVHGILLLSGQFPEERTSKQKYSTFRLSGQGWSNHADGTIQRHAYGTTETNSDFADLGRPSLEEAASAGLGQRKRAQQCCAPTRDRPCIKLTQLKRAGVKCLLQGNGVRGP